MLTNGTQCPNTVQEDSKMCKLHNAIEMYGSFQNTEKDNDSTGFKQE